MIKRNYYKIVRVFPDPSSYFYVKNETMSEGQIGLWDTEWVSQHSFEYSFDKVNWTPIRSYWNEKIPADSYMYFRNSSGTFNTENSRSQFHIGVNASIGGDIRTLFNYTDVDNVTTIPTYGLYMAFQPISDYKIIDISNLSFRGITSISNYGLYYTFSNSNNWFSITKGVDLRDVTTLGEGALNNLYSNNSNLKEVYAPNVSTWDTSKASYWLNSVASTGVVYKPSTLTIPTDYDSGIPYGWTTQDYPIK